MNNHCYTQGYDDIYILCYSIIVIRQQYCNYITAIVVSDEKLLKGMDARKDFMNNRHIFLAWEISFIFQC